MKGKVGQFTNKRLAEEPGETRSFLDKVRFSCLELKLIDLIPDCLLLRSSRGLCKKLLLPCKNGCEGDARNKTFQTRSYVSKSRLSFNCFSYRVCYWNLYNPDHRCLLLPALLVFWLGFCFHDYNDPSKYILFRSSDCAYLSPNDACCVEEVNKESIPMFVYPRTH